MSQYKHAELMKMYAEDAMATNKPWEHWEYEDKHGWHSLSQHPCWSENTDYRRKPKEYQMTNSDWERVIDERFYVRYESENPYMFTADVFNDISKVTPMLRVVREKGLRQPYFAGDRHPEGDTRLILAYVYVMGSEDVKLAKDVDNWGDVAEYIIL